MIRLPVEHREGTQSGDLVPEPGCLTCRVRQSRTGAFPMQSRTTPG